MTHHGDDRPRLTRWCDRWLSRWGVTTAFRRDCLLAAVVAVATVALFGVGLRLAMAAEDVVLSTARLGAILVAAGLQSLLLCLRRVRPVLCLAATVGCQLVVIAAVPDATFRGIAAVIAAYTVASRSTVRVTLLALSAAVLAESAVAVVAAARYPTDLVIAAANQVGSSVVSYGLAAFIGTFVATRRSYLALVRAQAAAVVREQEARLRDAITGERSRIARELHDVAAHHLSSMVVQASAVERLVERDPSGARAGAAWIRRQGKETLDNLRLVVGLLRERDPREEGRHPALPGLAALDDLVQTSRELGTPVDLVRVGEPFPLPPLADASVYRVAQQALTNARQHSPGAPVRVRLEYSDRDVVLEVVNDASMPPATTVGRRGGTGLVGMRERADLLGAELTAGPTDRGWRVRLRLPIGAGVTAGGQFTGGQGGAR